LKNFIFFTILSKEVVVTDDYISHIFEIYIIAQNKNFAHIGEAQND